MLAVGGGVIAVRVALIPVLGISLHPVERRIQLSAGGRHIRTRAADQSHASVVDPLRKLPHHPAAHVHVHVSSGTRTGARGGATTGESVDRTTAHHGIDVLGNVLDVAGLAASKVGAAGRSARRTAPGHSELLDELLLVRLRRGAGGNLVLGAWPRVRKRLSPGQCTIIGSGFGDSGEQPAV